VIVADLDGSSIPGLTPDIARASVKEHPPDDILAAIVAVVKSSC